MICKRKRNIYLEQLDAEFKILVMLLKAEKAKIAKPKPIAKGAIS